MITCYKVGSRSVNSRKLLIIYKQEISTALVLCFHPQIMCNNTTAVRKKLYIDTCHCDSRVR